MAADRCDHSRPWLAKSHSVGLVPKPPRLLSFTSIEGRIRKKSSGKWPFQPVPTRRVGTAMPRKGSMTQRIRSDPGNRHSIEPSGGYTDVVSIFTQQRLRHSLAGKKVNSFQDLQKIVRRRAVL